jgi:cytochrome c-type protein NapC
MNFEKQGEDAAEVHPEGFDAEVTCIECHKGLAHKLPEGYEE